MKYLLFLFLSTKILLATYMGKIEPISSVAIKSQNTGIVKNINTKYKNTFVENKTIVKLDSEALDIEILYLKKELKNIQKIFDIQKQRFDSKKKISTISKYEKKQEELSMRNAMRNLLSIKKQLDLKKIIKSKTIFKAKNKYIGNIYVQNGDFVSTGSLIMDIYDISSSKITIFVEKKDISYIRGKDIYINNKKSTFQIRNISNIPDRVYISLHKVELVKKNKGTNNIFGNIAKVDFR